MFQQGMHLTVSYPPQWREPHALDSFMPGALASFCPCRCFLEEMNSKTRTILALGKTEPWGSVQISHPVTFPFIYFADSLSRSLDFYSSTMGAEQSRKDAESFDTNDDGELSASEIHHYTDEHLELWLALSEQCGINEDACRKIAVQVAMAMATKDDTTPRNPTTKEFGAFLHKLGTQQKTRDEFFHRTVFVAFDTNQNGTLERKELFGFLDVLYNLEHSTRCPKRKRSKHRPFPSLMSIMITSSMYKNSASCCTLWKSREPSKCDSERNLYFAFSNSSNIIYNSLVLSYLY